jgi:hypothetical protein
VKRLFGLLIVVMTVATADCTSKSSPTVGSVIAESSTASRSVAEPTSTPLPKSGETIYPGTYAPAFQPKMTFASSSRWEVDVDTPAWLGMEFPLPDQVLGTIGIVRVEKVFDPEHGGKLIDPPKDLAGWIAKLPGLRVVAPPTPVKVGGIEGEQLDVLIGPEDVGVSPIQGSHVGNGFPKGYAVRITVVNVDGQNVQISFAPDEVGSRHFKAAVVYAQPLIHSIRWG